jgi:hypothetical protein
MDKFFGFALIFGVLIGIIKLVRQPKETEIERATAEWRGW